MSRQPPSCFTGFMRTLVTAALAASFSLVGCGYYRGIAPVSSGPKIAIPLFENATFEPILDRQTTRAVKEAFLARGFNVTGDPNGAPIILAGKISSFEKTPISLNAAGSALEYRVKIGTKITLRYRGETEGATFIVEEAAEFFSHSDTILHRAAEDRAIREASLRLAERMVDLLFTKSGALRSTKR